MRLYLLRLKCFTAPNHGLSRSVAAWRVSILCLTSVTLTLWKKIGAADQLLRGEPEKIEKSVPGTISRAITPVLLSAKARIEQPSNTVGRDLLYRAALSAA
jgi:hypothetical protein